MTFLAFWILSFLTFLFAMIALALFNKHKENQRAAYIRTYAWPPGLLEKLSHKHAGFTRKESALVSQGLRHFFLSYLKSGRQYVAMPSQVADDLWHEFILYTREYKAFCDKAFGQFLHHTPAAALSPNQTASNAGLRRVWWHCCKEESISPSNPTRLPLLFALDAKFKIPNGFVYSANCDALRRNGAAGVQCGGDFSSSSVDGSVEGFGDSSSGDGDGGGGGCGGGD